MSERALHAAEKTNFSNFSPIINQETVLGIPAVPKYSCKVSSSYSKYDPRKIEKSEFSVFLAASNAVPTYFAETAPTSLEISSEK